MNTVVKTTLLLTILLVAGYVLVNVPGCEGGGVKRVNGEWVSFATLSEASLGWPRSRATVVDSNLDVNKTPGSARRKDQVRFRIRYQFSVDGKDFEGDTGRFVAAADKELKAWSKQVPKGKRIEVSYDPENPRLSVIIPGDTN
jgi:hypothetical protein